MDEKKCSNCGETKPLKAFYCHLKTKDGRQSQCKKCMKAAASARGARIRAANKARLA